MTIRWDLTSFDRGARKVFHVVPSATTDAVYRDICNKYGSETVFRCDNTADDTDIEAAIAACTSQGNDIVRLYPGTFKLSGQIDVSKAVTIEGASDNPNAAIIDCDTNNVAAFAVTVSGVTIRNLTVAEANSAVAYTIGCANSNLTGFVVENVIIRGGDVAHTSGSVYSLAQNTIIRNCKLYAVQGGIKIGGSNSVIENNIIIGGSAAVGSFGIFLFASSAVRSGQIMRNNTVIMPGATSCLAVSVLPTSSINAVIFNNNLYSVSPNWSISTDTYTTNNLPVSQVITASETWVAV